MCLRKYSPQEMKNIHTIGIIMFGLLGDVILRTSVIRALKELYPAAKITVLVDPIGKAVLKHNRDVDEIRVFDRTKEKNKLKQNLKKVKSILRVRKEKFDLLVNLYNGGISRPMVFFSSAKYKLGFCKKENKYLYNVKNECDTNRLRDEQILSSFMISIVEPLSKKKFSLRPVFDLEETMTDKIKSYLKTFPYDFEKLYILNLASSKEDKILSFEKYFFIVKYIYEKYGYIPAVVCNPSQEYLQQQFIDEFLQMSDIPFIKLKTMRIEEIAALIKLCKFMVTPDTGLMHLAMAFDNYILTLFTYTHPIFVDPKNEKFIAVYESFDEGKLYQHQNISQQKLKESIDLLFERINT